MLHKEFWGLVFLAFVVWIFASSSPNTRLERGCKPVGWTGNVIVSLSALVLPDQQKPVQRWFDRVEYGCQYTVWRLFFQDEYNEWRANSLGVPPGDVPPAASPVSAASAPAAGASAPGAPASTPAQAPAK